MTPDKVEAALASLKQLSAAIACPDLPRRTRADESRWAAKITDALSVLTEALAKRGWRPIESAPRDSERVLIFDPTLGGGFVCIALYWMGEWRHGSLPGDTMFPTHWKPLPEPPHDR